MDMFITMKSHLGLNTTFVKFGDLMLTTAQFEDPHKVLRGVAYLFNKILRLWMAMKAPRQKKANRSR